MTYSTGFVGPVVYTQDNSGVADDTETKIEYTPQQYGAPADAKIIAGSVTQSYWVQRGLAYVKDVSIEDADISFLVYSQAAGGFPFGHHSGSITVSTSFQWYAGG